jgi:DNA topoisomerase-1
MQRGRFVYLDEQGQRVTQEAELARIAALAIPPAYTDVWICSDACGHLQATGRDARGRKQYRYHPAWRTLRDAGKYQRMAAFGAALARMRARVERDLHAPGTPRAKVLATVVKMLDTTLIRIGGAEYARANRSYGLTTLRKRHLRWHDEGLRLKFAGKSGVEHDVTIRDRRIVAVVRRCMEIPGHELFQYLDGESARHALSSSDINAYLHDIGGSEFTAKDYRTWAGNVHALAVLRTLPADTLTQARKNVVAVVKQTALLLRNTPAVCRRCYLHPDLLEAYEAGELSVLPQPGRVAGLRADEVRLLALLGCKAATQRVRAA